MQIYFIITNNDEDGYENDKDGDGMLKCLACYLSCGSTLVQRRDSKYYLYSYVYSRKFQYIW